MEAGSYQSSSRLQRAFNVPCRSLVNSASPFQTELAIDTNTRVADAQTVITNIEKKVADIHQSVLTGQGGSSGKDRSVGATFHPPVTKSLSLSRLKPG